MAARSILSYERLATLTEITRRLKGATTQSFPCAKLADDGTRFGPGRPVVTPSFDGLVEDADAMARAIIVERKPCDSSWLDVLWAPYLVSGLCIVALLIRGAGCCRPRRTPMRQLRVPRGLSTRDHRTATIGRLKCHRCV